ncbi:MAG: hypothetical protein RR334_01980, partial [Clostridia bacterium]
DIEVYDLGNDNLNTIPVNQYYHLVEGQDCWTNYSNKITKGANNNKKIAAIYIAHINGKERFVETIFYPCSAITNDKTNVITTGYIKVDRTIATGNKAFTNTPSYIGYIKGNRIAQTGTENSFVPFVYSYGEFKGWSLGNAMLLGNEKGTKSTDVSSKDITFNNIDISDTSITDNLSEIKLTPNSPTDNYMLYAFFKTMSYTVSVDITEQITTTVSTFSNDNTTYLFDKNGQKIQDSYGNYLRQSMIDYNESNTKNHLIYNSLYYERISGKTGPTAVTDLNKNNIAFASIDWKSLGATKTLTSLPTYINIKDGKVDSFANGEKGNPIVQVYKSGELYSNYVINTTQENDLTKGTISLQFKVYAEAGAGFPVFEIKFSSISKLVTIAGVVVEFIGGNNGTDTKDNIISSLVDNEKNKNSVQYPSIKQDTKAYLSSGTQNVSGFNNTLYNNVNSDDGGNLAGDIKPLDIKISPIYLLMSSVVSSSINTADDPNDIKNNKTFNIFGNVCDYQDALSQLAKFGDNKNIKDYLFGTNTMQKTIENYSQTIVRNSFTYESYIYSQLGNLSNAIQTNTDIQSLRLKYLMLLLIYQSLLGLDMRDIYSGNGENPGTTENNILNYDIPNDSDYKVTNRLDYYLSAANGVSYKVENVRLITVNKQLLSIEGTIRIPNFFNILDDDGLPETIDQHAASTIFKNAKTDEKSIPIDFSYINLLNCVSALNSTEKDNTLAISNLLYNINNNFSCFDRVTSSITMHRKTQAQDNGPEGVVTKLAPDMEKWFSKEQYAISPMRGFEYYERASVNVGINTQNANLITKTLSEDYTDSPNLDPQSNTTLEFMGQLLSSKKYAWSHGLNEESGDKAAFIIMFINSFTLSELSLNDQLTTMQNSSSINIQTSIFRGSKDGMNVKDLPWGPEPISYYWARVGSTILDVALFILSIATSGIGAIVGSVAKVALKVGIKKAITKAARKIITKVIIRTIMTSALNQMTSQMIGEGGLDMIMTFEPSEVKTGIPTVTFTDGNTSSLIKIYKR